jgi:hypothetical protein
MAALVLVLVMPFAVNVLVGMSHALMAVLMAVVAVRNRFVSVLMLMLVFIVAAHQSSLLSFLSCNRITIARFVVNRSLPGVIRGRTPVPLYKPFPPFPWRGAMHCALRA